MVCVVLPKVVKVSQEIVSKRKVLFGSEIVEVVQIICPGVVKVMPQARISEWSRQRRTMAIGLCHILLWRKMKL